MNTPPLGVLLVGAGGIGATWLDACHRSEVVELLAVCDADPKVQERHGLAEETFFCDLEGAVKHLKSCPHQEVAAIVATPPNSHPEITTTLARQGIHLLCEKPLATQFADALTMVDTARANDVVMTMASKFRFVDDIDHARALLHDGAIGQPVLFENSFTSKVDMTRRWNAQRAISGGGVLIDNGTHSLDIARFMLGALTHVQVSEGPRTQGLSVEESVHISLRSACGAMGSIDLSWSVHKPSDDFVVLYGDEGTIQVGWQRSRIKRGQEDWQVFGTGYDKTAAFCNQLENFVGAIRGEAELRIDCTDALSSVSAVEAAYRSLHQSAWEPIQTDQLAGTA